MVFRLLYTLEKCGMVEKTGENQYQSCIRPVKQKRYRLGYAAQGTDYHFSKDVSEGLRSAAAAEGIEMISVNNSIRRRDGAAQRRAADPRKGGPDDRVPNRRSHRADHRSQIP
jgi:hypothetical protein